MAFTSKTKKELMQRWQALQSERSSWVPTWQEISNYLIPGNGRFFSSDRNRGDKRASAIYDSEATEALNTLAAGLMSGATSPARPWFRLETHDPELNAYQPVKIWLDQVTNLIHRVFQKSNTYDALHELYLELGGFGTGACLVLPDYNNVIHNFPLTTGEYAIATDAKGNVNTLYREFEMTAAQMVGEFGKEKCSRAVQDAFDKGILDTWFPVIHAIEPRADRDVTKRDRKNMPWASWYFEPGNSDDKVLRESGFHQFRAVCPRWSKLSGDIYGRSPAHMALGDIKQLQHEQLRKAQGIDYKAKPPVAVPTSLRNQEVNMLPGGVTYVDPQAGQQSIKSLFEVNLDLSHLLLDIQEVQRRIRSRFFSDLFLMINQIDVGKMTATEVAARQEEKMLMLGPVVSRLNHELLQPMIDIAFTDLLEGGGVPEPPEELQGQDLNVEFISVLAQAQKAIGTNSIDRFVTTIGAVAAFKPEVLDKIDPDALVDEYSDKLGVPPSLIVASDKVAIIRDARAKAEAAAQQSALIEQQSKAAKNLATAPTNGQNALSDMMNQFSGYGSPSPQEVQ